MATTNTARTPATCPRCGHALAKIRTPMALRIQAVRARDCASPLHRVQYVWDGGDR